MHSNTVSYSCFYRQQGGIAHPNKYDIIYLHSYGRLRLIVPVIGTTIEVYSSLLTPTTPQT